MLSSRPTAGSVGSGALGRPVRRRGAARGAHREAHRERAAQARRLLARRTQYAELYFELRVRGDSRFDSIRVCSEASIVRVRRDS